jgi:ribulose-phosphate 3-epimerase
MREGLRRLILLTRQIQNFKHMTEIIPAIIGSKFQEIKDKIQQVEGLTEWVQIDVMDALFVPPYTWQNPGDVSELDGKTKIEVHLMVEKPELVISDWFEAADRIIVHVEASDYIEEIIEKMQHRHNKLGLALNLETPIETLEPYYKVANVVQLMGIADIGYQGHPFDNKVLNKIRACRAKFPDATIQIDGGITLETGLQCLEAGANNLVVGSAIWESGEVAETIKKFQSLN